jgi:hypothetical protein
VALSLPTVEDVRAVIETEATDTQVQMAIDDAALVVEACVAALPAARQEAIIKYVAAHFLSLGSKTGSGALSSQSLGDASESYATSILGEGLAGTEFGKRALLLDPNGCLARLGKRTVVFQVL